MDKQITNGLKSKTVYIKTSAGKTRFNLQLNNELGLPHDSKIISLQCREHEETITGAIGLKLVKTSVYNNAYLSLKDRQCNDGKINIGISQYPLAKLARQANFMEPIKSEFIDWNDSFIEVNSRASADIENDKVFEIVVYYVDECNPPIKERFYFRNGQTMAGKFTKYFEVPLNSTQRKYKLSNTPNIGLPQDAWVIGYSTKGNDFPLIATDPQDGTSLLSTYFTLKQGTNSFIEEYPAAMNDYKENLFNDLDYMPITPIQSNQIDWQQSNIIIADLAGVTNLMAFQFYLIWYRPKAEN